MPDREKVIKKAEHIMCSTVDRNTIDSFCEDVINLLKEQPEIIRCKDCDNKECLGREGSVVCGIDGTPHRPDWYCADGERQDGR